jgi:hypothetical protein
MFPVNIGPHRRIVRDVMHTYYPDGFDLRFPGQKKRPTPRTALFSLGPFNEVSADGHEKLGQQALRMGDLSLPIYAYLLMKAIAKRGRYEFLQMWTHDSSSAGQGP